MHESRLFEHVPPEHHDAARRLYATYVQASHGQTDLDAFATALHGQGLLPADNLKDFMTYRALTLGQLDASGGAAPTHYELMSVLGHGAMGEVYVGRDPSLKRTVAIKRVHADLAKDASLLQRFFNEAQVTAQLDHPAIVPVYALECDTEGALSYAMKLVRGETLTDFLDTARAQLKAGKVDAAHALKARIEAFLPVLNALAYAHRRGVIHRDLKPDNIMVGSFGEVMVMDWGLARLLADDSPEAPIEGLGDTGASTSPQLTLAGSVLGTPAFMSPEQAAGVDVDVRSDQYALGLILQEIVTLQPAMRAETVAVMFARAVRGMREPMTSDLEKIPRELRAIVARATAPKRDDRYASVADFADDLRRFLRDESVAADPDRGLRKVTRWVGNHRGLAAALAVAMLGLACAIVVVVVWRGQVALTAERDAARAYEQSLMRLEALVDAQARRMSEQLHKYEALLEGIAATAALALNEPAPPSDAVVYRYNGNQRTPAAAPSYARPSAAYQQDASLRGDYSAAWDIDVARVAGRIDQLARVEPTLRQAYLRSISDATADLPFAEAEAIVLAQGAPLLWTYLHTADGMAVGVPGTWMYDDSPGGHGYDHRRESWYRVAVADARRRGMTWTASADESGLGLTINAVQTIRDRANKVIAVAGVDIWLQRFMDDLLEIPRLTQLGAESILLDDQGRVMVRSSQKQEARNVSEYKPKAYEEAAVLEAIKAGPTGHLAMSGQRMAVWSSLGSAGLTYLVVGPADAMLR